MKMTNSLFILSIVVINILLGCSSISIKKEQRFNEPTLSQKLTKKTDLGFLGLETQSCDASTMGFTGGCMSDISRPPMVDRSALASKPNIPDNFKQLMQSQLGTLLETLGNPDFCIGDFKGSKIHEEGGKLENILASEVPVEDDGSFGVIGFKIPSVPCGVPTDIQFSVLFDKCGTVAMQFNLGLPVCISFYVTAATGIGAAISTFLAEASQAVGSMGFGISINQRFTKDVTVFYPDGNKVKSGDKTMKGHFYAQIEIGLPIDNIKLSNGKGLDEYLDLSVKPILMIDFGKVASTVNKLIDDFKNMNKSTARNVINTLRKSGAEALLSLEGSATLKLSELTNGVLPDLGMSGVASWVVSMGGGNSGLPTGLYFSIKSDIVREIINYVLGIVNVFGPIFKAKNISLPFPDLAVTLGLFVTPESMGFGFSFAGQSVQCMFQFSKTRLSCSVNAQFFDMLAEGAQFVFREATEFFSNTGKEIGRFAKEEWNSTVKNVSKDIKAAIGFVKNSAGQLLKIGSAAAKDVANGIKQGTKMIENGAKELVNSAGKKLSEAASEAADALKDAGKSIGKALKKW